MRAGSLVPLLSSRHGGGLAEYAVLLALLACVLVPATLITGMRTDRTFRSVFGTPGELEQPEATPAASASAQWGGPGALAAAASTTPRERAPGKPDPLPAVRLRLPVTTGTTYYVDAVNGSDASPGLASTSPWKSLAKVMEADLKPGDRVLLRRGAVWREHLEIRHSGVEGSPITFGAYGTGDPPRIAGSDVVTGWKRYDGNVWQAAFPTEPYQVFFDELRGTPEEGKGLLDAEGEWYWEGGTLYAYCKTDPVTAFQTRGVQACVRDCVSAWGQHHIRIEGLRLERGHYGLYLGQCSNVRCESVVSGWHYYDGLMADGANSSDLEFVSCTAHDNLRHGLHAHDATNVTVTGGHYYGNNQKYGSGVGLNGVQGGTVSGVDAYGSYYGVKAANGARDIVIRGNTAHHNASFGIDVDIGVDGATVEHNTVHDNGSHGICVEWESANCVVARNECYRNGSQRAGIFVEKVSNVIVCYNVVHDEYIGIGFNEGATNCAAYNNVVSNISGVGFHAFNDCSGITLKNNVAYACTDLAVHIRPDSQTGFVSDHNNWFVGGAELKWGWERLDFGQWKAATGQDAHSVCADPRFASPSQRDFRLQPDSPCIDLGEDVGLRSDYEDGPVPAGNAPDAGAFEAGGEQAGDGDANIPPTAEFAATPTAGPAPLRVRFDATGSDDPDGTIVSYRWDFGDGKTAAGAKTRHRYKTVGNFEVELTVTDDAGATAVKRLTVSVQEGSKQIVYVAGIEMSLVGSENGTGALARIALVDLDGRPVRRATVVGKWSGVVSGSCSASVLSGGKAVALSQRTQECGTYTFTVTEVRAEGYTYNPERNVETSDSVTSRVRTAGALAGLGAR